MFDRDVDPIIQQEIALDDIHDIASLEEDYRDGNNKSDEDELRITEIEYPDLDDVETSI
jgi:hypothetical protein